MVTVAANNFTDDNTTMVIPIIIDLGKRSNDLFLLLGNLPNMGDTFK
jgi:hypothetical protein